MAVVALVGAGVFALTQIGGNDDKGGAASPTEAGENLVAALNDEDILGAVDLLLPGERDTFRQPMIDLVDNLKRLEVLGDDADPSKVKGIDIDLADAKVTADTPAAPDITPSASRRRTAPRSTARPSRSATSSSTRRSAGSGPTPRNRRTRTGRSR